MAGFFKCPNALIDDLAKHLTPVEFMCMSIIVRKTRGWHKGSDPIALSQFMKLSGIKSNNTVIKALHVLSDSRVGLLEVSRRKGCTTVYKLGKTFDSLLKKQCNICTGALSNIAQVRVQNMNRLPPETSAIYAHTKESLNKRKEVDSKPEKTRGKQLKENGQKAEVKDKENGVNPEVKQLALARANQGLVEAGLLVNIEPEETETEEDFRIRMLGSITRGFTNALQS